MWFGDKEKVRITAPKKNEKLSYCQGIKDRTLNLNTLPNSELKNFGPKGSNPKIWQKSLFVKNFLKGGTVREECTNRGKWGNNNCSLAEAATNL